ncbi:MAG: hypothetical protein AB8G23_02825 [Myxococcota bacterium]
MRYSTVMRKPSISGRVRRRCSLLLTTFGMIACASLFGASSAFAQVEFVEWPTVNAGSGGGITASAMYTINAGTVSSTLFTPDAPLFVADYASTIPILSYASSALPADIDSIIEFSPPLPLGSVLLVLDVDVSQETFILESEGAALELLEQVESTLGAQSVFPSYDEVSGELIAPGVNNLVEVSVFDLEGVSSIDVAFLNGQSGSGGAIAIAVPEAGFPLQLSFGLMGALAARRQRASNSVASRRAGFRAQ